MPILNRTPLILLILFGCVGCDQATKHLAKQTLAGVPTIRLLGDTVRLHYTENPGAFLSLGANIPGHWRYLIFTLLVGAVLVGLLAYLLLDRRMDRTTTLAMSLVLGGGIGNLIDRVAYDGRVVDFLNLGIGPVRTGVFNVADMAITLGALLIVWLWFRQRTHGLRQTG